MEKCAKERLPAGELCEEATHDEDGKPIPRGAFTDVAIKWQWKPSSRDAHNMQGFLAFSKASADLAGKPGDGLRTLVPSDSLEVMARRRERELI